MQPESKLETSKLEEPASYAEAREKLIQTIRLELVGPDNGVDSADFINEILSTEAPLQRYKVGILYPKPETSQDAEELEETASSTAEMPQDMEDASKVMGKDAEKSLSKISQRQSYEEQSEEGLSDLAFSGIQRPASMAISFFISERDVKPESNIKFTFTGGVYKEGEPRVWARIPIKLESEKPLSELFSQREPLLIVPAGDMQGTSIRMKVFVRRYKGKGILVTLSAINETPVYADGRKLKNDERAVFQAKLCIETSQCISAYPQAGHNTDDLEEQSLDLLYRNYETFCIGHGCSAGWPEKAKNGLVSKVWSTAFPEYEIYSITPELMRENGEPISVSMADLAGLAEETNGFAAIDELLERYEAWIKAKRKEASGLLAYYHAAVEKNLNLCEECLSRMKEGRRFLEEDENARAAFRLANKAILIQQKRFTDKKREIQQDENTKRWFFTGGKFEDTESVLNKEMLTKGKWRPFQIAFLLLSLKSTVLKHSPDREIVDLIWFPTGGGKTEAYFGLAAFSILYQRLEDPEDAGVSVLMRYTLRLLTADQFERASGLICALEYIRREHKEKIGEVPFSIGIWLGQSTTPNSRAEAKKNLKDIIKGKPNKFLVTKCPWCAAQIGPVRTGRKYDLHGYQQEGNRVKLYCSDQACDFHAELPVYVVDEDIYDFRPTLIIGTVDKFAQIAWDPRCRYIFGIGQDGQRFVSPPNLIIQDELHLISGPLGSMVGLYETLIEEFCTDYRYEQSVKPKIVCSTATIRRFESQVKALYARPRAALFPSPGIEADDSFFAKWQTHEEQRGRTYIGIYGPGESIQTMQVRTMSIALQAASFLPERLRDPYWTLLAFFNSLRELGTTITLFQSDILTRLNILRKRYGMDWKDPSLRKLWNPVLELTSRLKNDEIDGVRGELKRNYEPGEKNYGVIDVCLASNIIEVGIDISRLSLMTIVGQPKTTAQYIQVSGRVGRNPDKPGLILTIYSAAKPRDRSHFEKFRTYHERLYAQVEPTSVTPFSGPAIDRALHAIIAGYLRQKLPYDNLEKSWPIPHDFVSEIVDKIKGRVERIYTDPANLEYVMEDVEERIEKFMNNWEANEISRWESKQGDIGLMYRAGSFVNKSIASRSFKTPQSMRNVDLECKGIIAWPMQKKDEE